MTLFVGVFYLNGQQYGLISLFVLLECMTPFFLAFEGRKPQARELVLIAVLCAISVAGRAAFFMLPNFKPVMAMCIISGVALGGESGFLVGALSMLVSNMLFSQGPWASSAFFPALCFEKACCAAHEAACASSACYVPSSFTVGS